MYDARPLLLPRRAADDAPPPNRALVVALAASLIAAVAIGAALASGRPVPFDPAAPETTVLLAGNALVFAVAAALMHADEMQVPISGSVLLFALPIISTSCIAVLGGEGVHWLLPVAYGIAAGVVLVHGRTRRVPAPTFDGKDRAHGAVDCDLVDGEWVVKLHPTVPLPEGPGPSELPSPTSIPPRVVGEPEAVPAQIERWVRQVLPDQAQPYWFRSNVAVESVTCFYTLLNTRPIADRDAAR